MKPVRWIGNSRKAVAAFPVGARREAGYQLDRVQRGKEPADWKPMRSIGAGVRELRIHEDGEYRVVYLATVADAVYVLHAFTKKNAENVQAGPRGRCSALSGVDSGKEIEMNRLKIEKGSGNIFRDIGFPEAEAHNLVLRAELMNRIEDFVVSRTLTQQQAAKVLGVTQPRLNLLLKGKIGEFSLDALVNMAARAGMRVEMKIRKAA